MLSFGGISRVLVLRALLQCVLILRDLLYVLALSALSCVRCLATFARHAMYGVLRVLGACIERLSCVLYV